jgi:hypothetical protein
VTIRQGLSSRAEGRRVLSARSRGVRFSSAGTCPEPAEWVLPALAVVSSLDYVAAAFRPAAGFAVVAPHRVSCGSLFSWVRFRVTLSSRAEPRAISLSRRSPAGAGRRRGICFFLAGLRGSELQLRHKQKPLSLPTFCADSPAQCPRSYSPSTTISPAVTSVATPPKEPNVRRT